MVDRDGRDVVAARQRVVHEAGTERLAGGVILDLFEERAADTEGHPTVDLALDDRRIDEPSAVVTHPVADNTHARRFAIDLDQRDVRAARIRDVRRLEEMRGLEPGGHAVRRRGHRSPGRAAAELDPTPGPGALGEEFAVLLNL